MANSPDQPSKDDRRLTRSLKKEGVDVDSGQIARLPRYIKEGFRTLLDKVTTYRKQSDTDDLTGLKSLRAIRRDLDEMLERRHHATFARRAGKAYNKYPTASVVMLDMDDFGQFNKEYSENAGNLALKHVAAMLQQELYGIDSIARHGGDEFSIIMRETTDAQACKKMAEVVKKIEATPFYYTQPATENAPERTIPLNVSISFGVTQIQEDDSRTKIIERANAEMKANKKQKKQARDMPRFQAESTATVTRKKTKEKTIDLLPGARELPEDHAITKIPDDIPGNDYFGEGYTPPGTPSPPPIQADDSTDQQRTEHRSKVAQKSIKPKPKDQSMGMGDDGVALP
ncbi:MAG: GGDEF domain-containing protein [Alphaproteobacteria bacterium]